MNGRREKNNIRNHWHAKTYFQCWIFHCFDVCHFFFYSEKTKSIRTQESGGQKFTNLIFFFKSVLFQWKHAQRSTYLWIECCVYTIVRCCDWISYFPLPFIDCFQLIWCNKRVRSSHVNCFGFGGAAVRTENNIHSNNSYFTNNSLT